MSAQFWPCPRCSRHIKRGDTVCPFCGSSAGQVGPTRGPAATRLSRAAIFAGAMGTAVATVDCGASAVPYGVPPMGTPVELGSTGASDGPSDAAADATSASATPRTDSSTPSDDAELSDSSDTPDVPSPAVPYGLPPGPGGH